MNDERQTIRPSGIHRSSFIVHRLIFFAFLFASAAAPAFAQKPYPDLKPMAVDAARAQSAGLRKIEGKHLTLWTDVPSSPAVDELPAVFDAAVPQWAAYFGVEKTLWPDWRMIGFLIVDMAKFKSAGVIPDTLPKFANGFSIGYELWMNEQPTDYYRRHLLLHEGTHGFMNTVLGSCGAPWFMEGTAELLGTHRWQDGKLKLADMPRNREEVPQWGRVKIVHDDIAAGRMRAVGDIVNDDVRGYLDNESYGWCWAFAAFLDGHPKYRGRFHALQKQVRNLKFNDEFRKAYRLDLPQLGREWLVFANELAYGTDVPRAAIDFRPGKPIASGGSATVTIAADRGWQSSGIRLEAGKTYRLRASGRYQIAALTRDFYGVITLWPCEPGGITIRYHRGRPLGLLLGAVEPDVLPIGTLPPMLEPIVVGLETTVTPATTGTLYLRVNDSNGELADNSGTLMVEIAPQ